MDQAIRVQVAGVWPESYEGSMATTEHSEVVSDAYQEHHRAVLRVARGVCGGAMAEEVTQDVFVHLWRHPEKFDPARGTLGAYLATIARGKAVDAVRAERSRRRREERSDDWAGRAGADDVDLGLLVRERAAGVAEAISRLPPLEREALAIAFYGQCTYQQTAVILGQPEGTIKSRIRAGLRRLGDALVDSPMDLPALVPIR